MSGKKAASVLLDGHKNTVNCKPVRLAIPETVTIPMSMHIGAPCTPCVKVGEEVKVGQLIGQAGNGLSVPIHSSVSGKVKAMSSVLMGNGRTVGAITIECDKEQTVVEGIAPPTINSVDDLVNALKESGLVGLGGAGFPAYMKVQSSIGAVDTLLVNGSECEPYCTTNMRCMEDYPAEVVEGAELIAKYMDVKNIVIAVEDEMENAIEALNHVIKDKPNVSLSIQRTRYPAGAEKITIFNCLGRVVPRGGLPKDAGVVIMNSTTLAVFANYVKTGMPLVEKTVTVDGSAIKNPQNVIVPIGMSFGDIIEACGGYNEETTKLINGGPMMGGALTTKDYPIFKQSSIILAFLEKDVDRSPETACIRCGRCVDHCPMNLMPPNIEKAYKMKDADMLVEANADLCIECGTCSFVCPAKKPIVELNRLAKPLAMAQIAVIRGQKK